MLKKKILLIGGGGNCHSVIDSVIAANEYDEIGIIDTAEAAYMGVPVIGTDDDVPSLVEQGWLYAAITVGSIGNTGIRRRLYEMVRKCGMKTPPIIDPSAIIAADAVIKEGCFVGKRAVINTGSVVEECCIINTGAVIEHDCSIRKFAHVSPGTVLCGQVTVGEDSHVGAGSVVRQGIKIGNKVLIGVGSVVVKDIPDEVTAYGNPCRVVR